MKSEQEYIDLFEAEKERIADELVKTDPLSDRYGRGLENFRSLEWRLEKLTEKETPAEPETPSEPEAPAELETPTEPEVPDEPETPSEPEPETAPESNVVISKEDIRRILSDARTQDGIQITAIFERAGYENLSSTPQSEYPRLLEILEEMKANA